MSEEKMGNLRLRSLFASALLVITMGSAAIGQDGDPLQIATPVAMEPGTPRGSYDLTPQESVDLASGHLNFTIPLHQIGGRGKAGYMMVLPIGMQWDIVNNPNNGEDFYSAKYSYLAESSAWATGAMVRYTPGRVVRRESYDPTYGTYTCSAPGEPGTGYTFYLGQTLTKIVWIEADGTEHELRDVQDSGAPASVNNAQYNCGTDPFYGGPDRGQIFESDDSQAISFYADLDANGKAVYDDITTLHEHANAGRGIAGWLLFADGTRYYANSDGFITTIQDRVGNTTTINYPASGYASFTVTDPLNRTTTVTLGSNSDTIQFPPSRTITVNWDLMGNHLRSDYSLETTTELFPVVNGSDGQVNPPVVSSVVLQDGSQYAFQYNSYGELAEVTLPQGGMYQYDYPSTTPTSCSGSAQACTFVVGNSSEVDEQSYYRRLTERRVYASSSESTPDQVTDYTLGEDANYNSLVTVSRYVPSPKMLVSQQLHHFYGYPTLNASFATPPDSWYTDPHQGKEAETDWEDASGNVLKKVQNVWATTNTVTTDVNICETLTTLGSVVSGTISAYDQYSNRTDLYEYDYGSAPSLAGYNVCPGASGGYARQTHSTFLTNGYDTNASTVAATTHIRDLIAEKDVYSGSGAQFAKTAYGYDAGSPTTESGAFGWTAPSHSGLGNLTSSSQYTSASAPLTSTFAYDILGNVLTSKDPNSNPTTYNYTDECQANRPPSGSIFAFPTTVTDALNHIANYYYDCATGNLVRGVDPNIATYNSVNNASASSVASVFNDPFERVTSSTRSQGIAADQTEASYVYTPTTVTTSSDLNAAGDGIIQTGDTVDGLGRPILHQEFFGGGAITVSRSYDALGRPYQVSNPYQSNTESPNYTTTTYDALDRVIQTSYGDGSTVATTYSNNTVTVTDPAGHSRETIYDGLGRITSVIEAPGNQNITTSYTYDPLNDLLTVTQSGLSTNCDTANHTANRVFSYDWAARLGSACNPESGTVQYGYDGDGNLTSRTDARGVAATFGYDRLNRMTSKSYSGSPGAPAVTYSYDTSSVPNAIGRLTQTSSSASVSNITSYDTLGRVTGNSQTTNGTTYSFTGYVYNRAGTLEQIIYPSGRTVTTGSFDSLGRPGSVSSNTATYASNIQYASNGAVKSLPFGNGLTETTTWNMARLQPTAISLGTTWNTNLYYCSGQLQSCTSNNGNVMEQDVTSQGTTYTEIYGYDALNRITSASENNGSNWSQTFGYDNFGNRAVTGSTGSGTINPVWTPTSLAQFTSMNQFKRDPGANGADQYDASGNQVSVAASASEPDVVANSMSYDAENRMISANIANTGAVDYAYDGDGRRVMKSVPSTGAATVYVYDGLGQLAAEYSNTVQPVSGTQYLTADHLGSTRLVTSASNTLVNGVSPGAAGTVIRCEDYMPFGEEIPNGVGGRGSCYTSGQYPSITDVVDQKFTGKERDAESGLDFFNARYMSSPQGRFTGADPEGVSASLFDPQRWDAYSYAVNNPLKFVDRDGENPLLATALIGAAVGAAGGAVFDVTNQLILNRWNFSAIDRREVAGATLGGAVSGGIAGLTLGLIPAPAVLTTSYLVTAAVVNGGANLVGGVVQREVDPNAHGSAVTDFATGAVGAAVGTTIAYARYPLPNVRKELAIIANSNRRSLRPQRVADFSRYANRQIMRNNAVGSVVGTSIANFATNLWSDLTSFFSQPKEQVTTKICYGDGGCPTDSPQPRQ